MTTPAIKTQTAAQRADAVLRAKAGVTLETVVTRILRTWGKATNSDIEAGSRWYGDDSAKLIRDLSVLGGVSEEAVSAVIAQTSPRTTWSRNVAVATAILQSWQMSVSAGLSKDETSAAIMAAGRKCGGMTGNIHRATIALFAAAEGVCPISTVNGPKTNAFARNLLGDRNAVTVDVWATRVALSPKWSRGDESDIEVILGWAGVYDAIAQAYRIAAKRAGVDATTIQATTWIVVRNGRAG